MPASPSLQHQQVHEVHGAAWDRVCAWIADEQLSSFMAMPAAQHQQVCGKHVLTTGWSQWQCGCGCARLVEIDN